MFRVLPKGLAAFSEKGVKARGGPGGAPVLDILLVNHDGSGGVAWRGYSGVNQLCVEGGWPHVVDSPTGSVHWGVLKGRSHSLTHMHTHIYPLHSFRQRRVFLSLCSNST